jgi:Na+-transporting methylmalonyl-CoA/oxaloacetate decarboxylase gamma subunit
MFQIFAKLFGSDTVINRSMDGIDTLVFTDQEKSTHKMELLKLYEPFKLAQRLLALLYSLVFLFVFLIAVAIWIVGAFSSNIEQAGYYMSIAKELAEWNIDTLGLVISLIIGFYFGGGLVEGALTKYKK